MYERDFIKRMIQQVTQLAATVLARIFGLVEEKNYSEALLEVENAYLDFYRMEGRMLLSLSADALIEILGGGGPQPDAARLFVLAELLRLEGDIHRGEGNTAPAQKRYLPALDLFLETALRTGITEREEKEPLVDYLARRLPANELPAALQLNLMLYYEFDRQYGRAEDWLLKIIDQGGVADELIQAGIGFYRRLLAKTDRELEAGEIFRDEVEEGLAELRGMKA